MSLASLTTAPIVEITPVPPPTCHDVTSSTPTGQALIVQLNVHRVRRSAAHLRDRRPPGTRDVERGGRDRPADVHASRRFLGQRQLHLRRLKHERHLEHKLGLDHVIRPSVASVGHARASGTGAKLSITCTHSGVGAGTDCHVTVTMSVTEMFRANKLVAVTSAKSKRPKMTTKVVTVGQASAIVGVGRTQVVDIRLNGTGKHLLTARGKLPASIVVIQTVGATNTLVSRQRLALKAGSAKHKKTR